MESMNRLTQRLNAAGFDTALVTDPNAIRYFTGTKFSPGERLLALHAVRRDTDRPGIYGCIVDFSEKTWRIEEKALVWEPVTPMLKNAKMAEIFSFLKFGQPGAIRLADGDVLMSHWCAEDGQYKTVATRIAL